MDACDPMPVSFSILFTDLDGTLLDESTYAFEPAIPAIRALQNQGIPIVFCTSKTFSETVLFQEKLGITDPFIVENGGAIYFRQGQVNPTGLAVHVFGTWNRINLGIPYRALVAQLVAIRELTGIGLRGFSDMNAEEIASDCGLSIEMAERARQRGFDEPFRLTSDNPENLARISQMAQGVGLTVTTGGRYHHLSGRSDKGRAVRLLCEFMRKNRGPLRSVGIGDSPNDISMLHAVDVPVIAMRPNWVFHQRLVEDVPNAIHASGIGPVGWNAAVMALLSSEVDDGE